MDYFPIFMNLQGRKALVVGGTEAAAQKARLLARAGADVLAVTDAPGPELRALLGDGAARRAPGPFSPDHLDDAAIVVASDADDATNRAVFEHARARGLPVNVVDRPELCSFIMPAFVDRSPVLVAVSSGGASPVLARLVRARIEALLPADLGRFAALAAAFRDQVKRRVGAVNRRRFWERALEGSEAADLAHAGEMDEAASALQRAVDRAACPDGALCPAGVCRAPASCGRRPTGAVFLVGAGPGDPDLLTLKALRLMQTCDAVLHDRLVPAAVLDRVRRDASFVPVGKAPGDHGIGQDGINAMMIDLARSGRRVLRLKCGDPFVFGRGGEELAALRAAGVPVEVVPGVTAALAAAASAGIPLTHRDVAQACVFLTGRSLRALDPEDWRALARPRQTLAVYMARAAAAAIRDELTAHGLDPATPAAVITGVGHPAQAIRRGRLRDLARLAAAAGDGPLLLIVGRAVEAAAVEAATRAAEAVGTPA